MSQFPWHLHCNGVLIHQGNLYGFLQHLSTACRLRAASAVSHPGSEAALRNLYNISLSIKHFHAPVWLLMGSLFKPPLSYKLLGGGHFWVAIGGVNTDFGKWNDLRSKATRTFPVESIHHQRNKLITQNPFLKITQTFSEKLYRLDFSCSPTNHYIHNALWMCGTALLQEAGVNRESCLAHLCRRKTRCKYSRNAKQRPVPHEDFI